MVVGNPGSAASTHAGTGCPAHKATQISPVYRSTSRRSGAVAWVYCAASAECID